MLMDTRWQQHLTAASQSGPPYKRERLDGVAGIDRCRSNADTLTHHPVSDSTRLAAILQSLGVASDVIEASIKRNGTAITRAAAIIAEWKAYLPEDCVKAMVRDGWHWST